MRYPTLAHLVALSDDVGVIQHGTHDVPNRSTGYCTDDVSRALIVTTAAMRLPEHAAVAERLGRTYLSFLHDAQMPSGRFRNFMGYDRRWLPEPSSEDADGRTVWALGYLMLHGEREGWKRLAARLLDAALPTFEEHEWLRGRAYAALGLAYALEADPHHVPRRRALNATADHLVAAYHEHRSGDWPWFEDRLIYANARLPEALFRAGKALVRADLIEIATRTLDFYASVVIEDGIFVPIGSEGWYPRGGKRARFAQQAIEAHGLVDAALAAWETTGSAHYASMAGVAMDWFFGKNARDAVMVSGGGCRDGIDEHSVNPNMGAESTISYLAAAIAIADSRIAEASRRQ